MVDTQRLIILAMVIIGLHLVACQKKQDVHLNEHPVEISQIDGSDLKQVTLTERAIERLDLKTDRVQEQAGKRVIPYSSLIYDPSGGTWVYTSPQPRTFVRSAIDVDRIEGDRVVLKEGPPVGTLVASVAVAELYGAEFNVGH